MAYWEIVAIDLRVSLSTLGKQHLDPKDRHDEIDLRGEETRGHDARRLSLTERYPMTARYWEAASRLRTRTEGSYPNEPALSIIGSRIQHRSLCGTFFGERSRNRS
jgi:hypothetical protein